MAFISKLSKMPDPLIESKIHFASGQGMHEFLSFEVMLSGHAELGNTFEGLDGVIRGAASLGARNAAYQIRKIARDMVPYDTGDLSKSGKVQISHKGEVQSTSAGRKIGHQTLEGVVLPEDYGESTESDDDPDSDPERVIRKGPPEFLVVFDARHAWLVHERTDIAYHQDNPGAPKSTRGRQAKYLEKAMAEVAPNYPDWVATEIDKALGRIRDVAPPPMSMKPRLVKRST